MNKYVFITMNIGGINGAEQYIYNKMNYLKQQGQQVFIFSGRPARILIDGFREYEPLINPALRFYPYCLSKREYAKTMAWIKSVVDVKAGDRCIVESSNVTSALWGELVAKELGCRHLAIIMQEHHNYSQTMRDFLAFKLERHELSGIMDDSVGKMLKDPTIPLRPDMRVRAYCNNVVQDCADEISKQLDPNADYTIGSIGRMEKEYVLPFVDALAAYFQIHSDKRYNLLMIGGCADKSRLKRIVESIERCGNVNLVLTGQLYPIPRHLVRQADVFISAAGSSTVSYYQQVPTIRIHHINAAPLGIIGYDYMLGGSKTPDPLTDRTLTDCVDQILNRTVKITYVENYEKAYYETMHAEFARHLHFGEEQKTPTFYDTASIRYTALIYRACSIVCRSFGVKITYGILEFLRKLMRGTNE